jgi:hypothetical protein
MFSNIECLVLGSIRFLMPEAALARDDP